MKRAVLLIIGAVILFIVLFPTAMPLERAPSTEEILISKALSSKKISLFSKSLRRDVYNNINGKQVEYNLLNVNFFNGKSLIDQEIDDFYSVALIINKEDAVVNISHYRTSMLYVFAYKKTGTKWMEKSNNFGRAKFEPSKAYYIYYEILKRKHPTYMDWSKFPIPIDSLQ